MYEQWFQIITKSSRLNQNTEFQYFGQIALPAGFFALGGALPLPKYGKYGKHGKYGILVFWLIEIRNFSIWLSAKLRFSRVLGYAFSCGVQVLCIKVLSDFKGLWSWDVLWHSRGTGRSSQKTWISKGATWKNKKLMDKSPRPSIEMMVSASKKNQSLKTNQRFNVPLWVDLINPSPLYPVAFPDIIPVEVFPAAAVTLSHWTMTHEWLWLAL